MIGTPSRSARGVAVQARILFIGRNVRVGVEEIRIGIQPVGSAMDVGLPVNVIRAGGSAHVDVRAARRSLLRVIHRSVHANFLNGLGCGEGIDSPIARYTDALLWTGSALSAEEVLTPVSFTTLEEATWLVVLPLNRFLASTPFSRNVLLVSRWPFAQTGWLPKPGVRAGSGRKFFVHARRKQRQAGKRAGRQRALRRFPALSIT